MDTKYLIQVLVSLLILSVVLMRQIIHQNIIDEVMM